MKKKFNSKIGSRIEVMHGKAFMTSGGLTKRQLKYNKFGKIVSRKASNSAKKLKNLQNAGYYPIKNKFGVLNINDLSNNILNNNINNLSNNSKIIK